MSVEIGVVVGREGQPLHWHIPERRYASHIEDSRSLWDIIWENRANLAGFAHSHPGGGLPGPSFTDVTTFAAIEAALGVRLQWWITSTDRLIELRWAGPRQHEYAGWEVKSESAQCMWVAELRRLSY